MAIFTELCDLFGITAEAPTTLGELFAWFMQIAVAVVIIVFAMRFIFGVIRYASRGR